MRVRCGLTSRRMTSNAEKIHVIEPLRGVAAIAVMWFHFTNGGGLKTESWIRMTGSAGWLGVEIFFVISGFIIPYALHRSHYRTSRHAGIFVLKRIARLDPPYLASIVVALALWYASSIAPGFRGEAPSVDPVNVLLHLAYLSAFFGYPWINPVYWTLAIEFQFYLLIALIFPMLVHASGRVRLLMVTLLCACSLMGWSGIFVFKYLGLFSLGIVAFQFRASMITWRTCVVAFAAAAVTTWFALSPEAALVGLVAGAVIAFVQLPPVAPLVFAGSISYSLYLIHVPIGGRVVNLGARFATGPLTQLLVLACAVLVTVAAAVVFRRLIEAPAQRLAASLRYR